MSGGVHTGTAPTGPEFVAARLGTCDIAGVGAFIVASVAILETELLLVGLPGLAGTNELGDAGKPAVGCLDGVAVAAVDVGMLDEVGVGVGVE